jgi:2-alkyl-3-oxoalkanoate reductase
MHPMKPWLRENSGDLPLGLSPDDSTSHALRRGLRKTWYTREGDIGDQVRQQQVPIIGEGQGVYSFVHIDDAAGATAAALECPPGAYSIVDGNPSPQHLWLTAFARAAGAPAPPRVSEEVALRAAGTRRGLLRNEA